MARILITGSSTGLGLMTGQLLIAQGHTVVLHGRNQARADAALASAPGAAAAIVGDLGRMREVHGLAEAGNRLGRFDAIIHNAGVGYREPRRQETEDGLSHIFAVNVLAPYALTALLRRPDRLVYLSSGMHHGASVDFADLPWTKRRWHGAQAYAESKLYDVILAFAVARRWPDAKVNALEPGWVPTRMGGPNAPDDISKAHVTQAWLAVSDDPLACTSGEYFFHQKLRAPNPATRNTQFQEQLISACARLSGVSLPP
jgi:NAD(P)-dependent dehydrogenase (short-subunit alcohol dehydrogenase family)